MTTEEIHETDESLKQSSKNEKSKKDIKKGGPYSKNEKEKRREEVYRLHFEYRYSARKIAEVMKVNRNTINGDIDFLYSEIGENVNIVDPGNVVVNWLEQMDIQLTRLRERLDKVKNNSERMAIERLIYEIHSKVLNTHLKLSNSTIRLNKYAVGMLNDHLKKNKDPRRYVALFESVSVSEKTKEKIDKVMKEDKLQQS